MCVSTASPSKIWNCDAHQLARSETKYRNPIRSLKDQIKLERSSIGHSHSRGTCGQDGPDGLRFHKWSFERWVQSPKCTLKNATNQEFSIKYRYRTAESKFCGNLHVCKFHKYFGCQPPSPSKYSCITCSVKSDYQIELSLNWENLDTAFLLEKLSASKQL